MAKRIVMAIDLYPPFIQGAERQTQMLSRQLAQRGYEVHVATVWHPGLEEYENDEGVHVHRVKGLTLRIPFFFKNPNWRRHHPPFPDPGIVVALRRLINQVKPNLVQSYGWISYSCAAALLGTAIPMIVSARDYGYSCATRKLLNNNAICNGPALAKCMRCATREYGLPKGVAAVAGVRGLRGLLLYKTRALHSISSYVQSIVRRDLLQTTAQSSASAWTGTDQVISNIYVPRHNQQPDADFLRQLPQEPYMLFVGALQHYKGLGTLLAAYAQLAPALPLVLIGTVGPGTPADFPANIRVLRDVPHHNVMAAWARCAFGVLPSLWPEPLGNVVLEAMHSGKAVVGARPGGHTDMIVDGETGLLVPAGDIPALAAAMQRLINDPALRTRLGNAARERAQLFAPSAILPQFETLHERLCQMSTGHNNHETIPLAPR